MIGLKEIEATQQVIRELRRAGAGARADAVEAVLAAATSALERQPGGLRQDLLTTGQAARALGVSLQTVKNWAEAGHFPLVRLGGRHLVHRDDLLRYLDQLGAEQRRGGSEAQPPWLGHAMPAIGDLPVHLVDRADQLHAALEADRELSAGERRELAAVEQELANAAAARLREAARAARRRA
jgi:excisionase family DNA binding protein